MQRGVHRTAGRGADRGAHATAGNPWRVARAVARCRQRRSHHLDAWHRWPRAADASFSGPPLARAMAAASRGTQRCSRLLLVVAFSHRRRRRSPPARRMGRRWESAACNRPRRRRPVRPAQQLLRDCLRARRGRARTCDTTELRRRRRVAQRPRRARSRWLSALPRLDGGNAASAPRLGARAGASRPTGDACVIHRRCDSGRDASGGRARVSPPHARSRTPPGMDGSLIHVAGDTARARIAHGWLAPDTPMTLGVVTLRPHQQEAVGRAPVALETHGGSLIADDEGLGKTFVALALAASARRPLVIGPAGLRAMWTHACAQTNVHAPYRSYESLSRSPMAREGYDLVNLDEAHHVRTPRTLRYRHLAQGLAGARVVLLTATPIHNSDRDLRALLALFLGAIAWALDDAGLSAHVIRREQDDVALDAPLPLLVAPRVISLSDDEDLLDALIALPAPVPPRDGGDGGALLSFTLARLWASSHFALRTALRRRLQRARALEDALICGRHPTRGELRAWALGEDATQLAFPELVASGGDDDVGDLLGAVRAHAAALEPLLRRMPIDSPGDRERADRIRDIVARHRGEKIVAFTQFADTAAALFRLLRASVRSCRLDGRGAQVA